MPANKWIVLTEETFNRLDSSARAVANLRGVVNNGNSLAVPPAVRPAPPYVQGGKARMYVVKAVVDDLLRCHSYFDGKTEGKTDLYVCMTWKLMRTPWDGVTINYKLDDGTTAAVTWDYTSATQRDVSHSTADSSQVDIVTEKITPAFLLADSGATDENDDPFTFPGDIIWAVSANDLLDGDGKPLKDPDGKPVILRDTNVDARAWSA